MRPGYATADLNATHRFSKRVEGVVQVLNVGDSYHADVGVLSATVGRQIKAGMRLRF
jgi:hypothetical protein